MTHPADRHFSHHPDARSPLDYFRLGYEACQHDQGRGVPSISEVQAYCAERQNGVNPQLWFDHYSANGWMVGRNKMRDWKAAVRTWERNNINTQQQPREMRAVN